MDWPINVLFVVLGALLTWISPPTLKSTWIRVVAGCIGRHTRLASRLRSLSKAPLHKQAPLAIPIMFYLAVIPLLYPQIFVTESRDAEIQEAIKRDERAALYRRQPWSRRFAVVTSDSVPPPPLPEHLRS